MCAIAIFLASLAMALLAIATARHHRGFLRLLLIVGFCANVVAAYRVGRLFIQPDTRVEQPPCGDDCLAPGEEMLCILNLETGEVKCAKATPRPEGTEI